MTTFPHTLAVPSPKAQRRDLVKTLSDNGRVLLKDCVKADWGWSPEDLADLADRVEAFHARAAPPLVFDLENPSPEEIGEALLVFVSAWPNASGSDLAGYGAQLINDVVDEQPSRFALTEALRNLRRSSRFLPSIAEVISQIQASGESIENLRKVLRWTGEQAPLYRQMAAAKEELLAGRSQH